MTLSALFQVKIFRPVALAGLLLIGACATPRQAANPHPRYKVGKAYKVDGRWYHPREDPDYQAVGMASWYGRDFHGRLTANGEIFDMNRLSAAHKTLPLPSMVEVKNLENGRKIIVRVNDRGPFAKNRVIDLSREAARRLGFERQGTARVRVRYLRPAPLHAQAPTDAPHRIASAARVIAPASPSDDPSVADRAEKAEAIMENASELLTAIENAPALTPGAEAFVVAEAESEAEGPVLIPAAAIATPEPDDTIIIDITKAPESAVQTLYIIRVAALSRLDNIEALKAQLAPAGPLRLSRVEADDGRVFYRVTMGPFASIETAAESLEQVRAAGYDDASMVTLKP